MSILIRGMTMPKNCLECDIRGYDANAGEEYCPITNIVALNIGRQKDCPLVELPSEHGRLIDADELMRDINKYHLSDGKFQHWVEVQSTVIEAEGEE